MKLFPNPGRLPQNSTLLQRTRNFSEPPHNASIETRSKIPTLLPVEYHNTSIQSSDFIEDKPLINLKQVLLIEEKLWEILEKLRQSTIDKISCEDYWALTENSAVPYIEKLFSERRTKSILRQACIVELAAIAFVNIIFIENLSPEISQQFRNLFYYVHQNFLSIMRLVLCRCTNDSLTNSWTHVLKEKVQEKQVKVAIKGGVSKLMKHHTALSCKILERIINLSPVFYRFPFLNVLKALYCTTYLNARKLIESVLIGLPTMNEMPNELPPLPKVPYLGPNNMTYTLVMDLDETLVHYVDNGPDSHLNIRPGCYEFLEEASKYYELVIFTAAIQEYADWAIDTIDLQKKITSRLYRQHTLTTGPGFIKDLSRLGRDLSKVIIIDNVADNFRLQSSNGLYVKSWFDDMEDTYLSEILHLLKEIAIAKVPDVRVALQNYRDQVLRQIIKGVQNPHLNLLSN